MSVQQYLSSVRYETFFSFSTKPPSEQFSKLLEYQVVALAAASLSFLSAAAAFYVIPSIVKNPATSPIKASFLKIAGRGIAPVGMLALGALGVDRAYRAVYCLQKKYKLWGTKLNPEIVEDYSLEITARKILLESVKIAACALGIVMTIKVFCLFSSTFLFPMIVPASMNAIMLHTYQSTALFAAGYFSYNILLFALNIKGYVTHCLKEASWSELFAELRRQL